MNSSKARKILIPIGDATEVLDTFCPLFRFEEAGFVPVVAGPKARLYHLVLHEVPPDSSIPWDITQERPGYHLRAEIAFGKVHPKDYVALFLSGGRAPEYLRDDEDLLRITRHFFEAGKPVASVCHGIEILAITGVIKGRTVTTVKKCRFDAEAVGATYVDREVVVDGNLVCARTYHDNWCWMREFMKLLSAR